jgi:hypothetical protein
MRRGIAFLAASGEDSHRIPADFGRGVNDSGQFGPRMTVQARQEEGRQTNPLVYSMYSRIAYSTRLNIIATFYEYSSVPAVLLTACSCPFPGMLGH